MHYQLLLTVLLSLASLATRIPTTSASSVPALSWRLMSGSSGYYRQNSVCGNLGAFSPSFTPGSRRGSIMAIDPVTSHIYVFGGRGYPTTGISTVYLGDMWCHRQSTWDDAGEWAWLGGRSDVGNYNGRYTGSLPHYPGSRQQMQMWVTHSGVPYLFAGYGYDGSSTMVKRMSDLWKFDPISYTWDWINGASLGNSLPVYSYDNTSDPGAVASCALISMAGHMFVFGGDAIFPSSIGHSSDTWEYNVTTNMWDWVNGPGVKDAMSVAGPSGSYLPSYHPGGRWGSAMMGKYLYGGIGKSSTSEGYLADLWRFETDIKQWAYITGESSAVDAGALGLYTGNPEHPGSRYYLSACWANPNIASLIHLFGGFGYGESGSGSGALSDFWGFNTTSGLWSWIGGSSNAPGDESIVGKPASFSSLNIPGARTDYAAGVSNGYGLMYLFGGSGVSGYQNDLWSTRGPEIPSVILVSVTPTPSPSPSPSPVSDSNAYKWGVAISLLAFTSMASVNIYAKSGLDFLYFLIDAMQFVALMSQLSIPMAKVFPDFTAGFGWTLPVVKAPFNFQPALTASTTRRRLLASGTGMYNLDAVKVVFGSDVRIIALNYLPALLFWMVILVILMVTYVLAIDKVKKWLGITATKSFNFASSTTTTVTTSTRDSQLTQAQEPKWPGALGAFLRVIVLTYYASCLSIWFGLIFSLPGGSGVFALAITLFIVLCLGIPVLWSYMLWKTPESARDTPRFTTIYAAFIGGFKQTHLAFALPMLFQKLLSALFIVVLTNVVQMVSILAIYVAIAVGLVVFSPHESPTMRKMMMMHSIIRILNVLVLLIASFLEDQSSAQIGLSIALLVLNISALFSIVLIFLRTIGLDRKIMAKFAKNSASKRCQRETGTEMGVGDLSGGHMLVSDGSSGLREPLLKI